MKTHDPHSGDWQNLDNDQQMRRYHAIASLVPPASDLLDVGCGEAILADYLHPSVRYLGLEPSSLAVQSTRPGRRKVVQMLAEEAIDRVSRWDRIVFTEVLYYLDDPLGVLRKYATMLSPTGRIIITIYQKQRQRPGLRKWLRKLRHPRHPLTNLACLRAVEAFLASEGWTVHVRTEVARPGSTEAWALLEVSP